MSLLDKQEVQDICGHTALCARKMGADLYVNERQKIRHYRARSNEEGRRIRRIIESVDSISSDERDSP